MTLTMTRPADVRPKNAGRFRGTDGRKPYLEKNSLTDAQRRALAEDGKVVRSLWKKVHRVAPKVAWMGLTRDDLAQSCFAAVMYAASTYRPVMDGRKTRFLTYATWYIRRGISDAIQEVVPAGLKHRARGASRECLRAPLSLDRHVASGGEPSRDKFGDLIAAPAEERQTHWDDDQWDAVLAVLPGRQRDIVRQLYREGVSGEKIGRDLGISRARVHQIARAAVQRLRVVMGVGVGEAA